MLLYLVWFWSKSLLGTHVLSISNRSPKFGLKLPQVVLNWKQVQRYVTTWRLLTIVTWLIHGYPYPQSSHFFHLTNLGLVGPGTCHRVLFSYVCTFLTFLALQTYWHTLQTSNCDNQAILLRFALISRVKFFKTLTRLMFAIEARNLTKICNQQCSIEYKFQIYVTIILVVTIPTRLTYD